MLIRGYLLQRRLSVIKWTRPAVLWISISLFTYPPEYLVSELICKGTVAAWALNNLSSNVGLLLIKAALATTTVESPNFQQKRQISNRRGILKGTIP